MAKVLKKDYAAVKLYGYRIAQLRTNRGWNQAELARKSGMTKAALSKYESPKENMAPNPDGKTLAQVADALETTTAYLLTGEKAEAVDHARTLGEAGEQAARRGKSIFGKHGGKRTKPQADESISRGGNPEHAGGTILAGFPPLMTREQAQEALQISRATFHRMADKGELPGAFKVGGAWRVRRDQLEAWIAAETEPV